MFLLIAYGSTLASDKGSILFDGTSLAPSTPEPTAPVEAGAPSNVQLNTISRTILSSWFVLLLLQLAGEVMILYELILGDKWTKK